ncbi:MAG: hypothetical protein WBF93_21695 [Pirellulales bacterium]
MPSFEQAKDILDHAKEFHHRVARYYLQLEDQVAQQRVKMMLNYLSRHEDRLADALQSYEENASRKILNTWVQFVYDDEILKTLGETPVQSEMSVDDVVDLGLRLDDRLINCFKMMVDAAETDDVREVFQNLVDMEEQEKRQLVRNAGRSLDI